MDIMRQYSRLLENFNVNDEMVNDCIFTMMHHIAGDLRNVNVLLQPSILRVFLRIWREGFELCGVSVCVLLEGIHSYSRTSASVKITVNPLLSGLHT